MPPIVKKEALEVFFNSNSQGIILSTMTILTADFDVGVKQSIILLPTAFDDKIIQSIILFTQKLMLLLLIMLLFPTETNKTSLQEKLNHGWILQFVSIVTDNH